MTPLVTTSLVRRTAGVATAEVIIDTALAHTGKCQRAGREETLVCAARAGAPKKFKHRALWKFRRAAQPAIHRIGCACDGCGDVVEFRKAELFRLFRTRAFRQLLLETPLLIFWIVQLAEAI